MTTGTPDLDVAVPDAPTPVRQWSITTTAGFTATGYLPAWSEEDPTTTGVTLDQLPTELADVSHRTYFDGQVLRIHDPESGAAPSQGAEERALWGVLVCNPHAEAPDPHVPVVNIAILGDYWINHLDPDGLAELAGKLRVQADRLDQEIRPQLIAARADWAAHLSA